MHFSKWRALFDGNHIAHISSAAGSPAVDRWLLDGHGVSHSLFKVIGTQIQKSLFGTCLR
jgi:hypothetical protein